jgi:RHS repeat-associated protein
VNIALTYSRGNKPFSDRKYCGNVDYSHNSDSPTYYYAFCLYDRLGSVHQLINRSGGLYLWNTFDPFGKILEGDGFDDIHNPFGFAQQYYDYDTGQYYMRARHYYPAIGRFTARDPINGKFTEPLSLHKYLYCANDPINYADPLGLLAQYVTINAGVQGGTGYVNQLGIVWDDQGHQAVIVIQNRATFHHGWATPGIGMGVSYGRSEDAADIYALSGWGEAYGFSVPIYGTAGFGLEYFEGDFGGPSGWEVSYSESPLPIPELHHWKTLTTIRNEEETEQVLQRVKNAWEDAMYDVQTWGESEQWLMVEGTLDNLDRW